MKTKFLAGIISFVIAIGFISIVAFIQTYFLKFNNINQIMVGVGLISLTISYDLLKPKLKDNNAAKIGKKVVGGILATIATILIIVLSTLINKPSFLTYLGYGTAIVVWFGIYRIFSTKRLTTSDPNRSNLIKNQIDKVTMDNLELERSGTIFTERLNGNISNCVTYHIIEIVKKKSIWGERRNEYNIEFSDGKNGNLSYSFSDERYFFTKGMNRIYYLNKESALNGLHFFLSNNKILNIDRYYMI